MERLVLSAPDIFCEHCINALTRAVNALDGAHMVEGNIEAKQVTVEFDAAQTSLDQIKAAMEEEGYPVAATWTASDHHEHGHGDAHEHGLGEMDQHGHADEHGHRDERVPGRPEDLVFSVRLLTDGLTAEVGYQCPCGCNPQAIYLKESGEAGHEHCCCGRAHFVGSDATRQLGDYLAGRRANGQDHDRTYTLGEQHVEAPWGGTLTVAIAVPQ